jgi:hypothetical protein
MAQVSYEGGSGGPVESVPDQAEEFRQELGQRGEHAAVMAEQAEREARMWRQVQSACEEGLRSYVQDAPAKMVIG